MSNKVKQLWAYKVEAPQFFQIQLNSLKLISKKAFWSQCKA